MQTETQMFYKILFTTHMIARTPLFSGPKCVVQGIGNYSNVRHVIDEGTPW
jgi:hypothetical protein